MKNKISFLDAWREDEKTVRGLWALAAQLGEGNSKRVKLCFKKFCGAYTFNPEKVREAINRAESGEFFYPEEVRDRILYLDRNYVLKRAAASGLIGAGFGAIIASGMPKIEEVNFFIALPYFCGLGGFCIGAMHYSINSYNARDRFERRNKEKNGK